LRAHLERLVVGHHPWGVRGQRVPNACNVAHTSLAAKQGGGLLAAIAVVHGRQLRGDLKIIAASLEQPVIEKILTHLGLQARAPPRTPARGHILLQAASARRGVGFQQAGDAVGAMA